MKLLDFALMTDENIDPEVVAYLRQLGFDVADVVETGQKGLTDVELLRLAVSQDRVVVTHDADFGTLAVLQNEPLIGIVYLRPAHFDAGFTTETLDAILTANPELAPQFILVAKRAKASVTIRIRQLGP